MAIQVDNAGPKPTETVVSQFEKRIGFSLPVPYRSFLLKFNGGRPYPYHFAVPNWYHRKSLINDFYGIVPGEYNDLEENIELLRGRLPKGFIPIADDPGGNCILISTEAATYGKVYLWDHENEPENASENLSDYPNIYILAINFDEFLNNLRDENEL